MGFTEMGFRDCTSGNDEGSSVGRVVGSVWVQVHMPTSEYPEYDVSVAPADDPTDLSAIASFQQDEEAELRAYLWGYIKGRTDAEEESI